MTGSGDRIERVAREAFGFEALRPGQREAIESVLDGRDTVAVMSTGSGKSAIYQIAGLLSPGATVVVSPSSVSSSWPPITVTKVSAVDPSGHVSVTV